MPAPCRSVRDPLQHCPTPIELDYLELLTSGALLPTSAFNEPGSPVTLTLPEAVAPSAGDVSRIELIDPEAFRWHGWTSLAPMAGRSSRWRGRSSDHFAACG
jgi:hypothetical protein